MPPGFLCRRLAHLDAVAGLVHGFETPEPGLRRQEREPGRQRVASALADAGRLYHLRQVHGARVAAAPWELPPEADAALSDSPGEILAIETADCLAVLIADPVTRRVAAAHAGWRGTALGAGVAAARALLSRGSRAEDLRVGLGPAIGQCCYQVGDEVRSALGAAFAGHFVPDAEGRFRLDLVGANRQQLEALGVPGASIAAVGECTSCRADLYPSYRRDGVGAGRLISVIGFRRG
jgi:YfiH family protein